MKAVLGCLFGIFFAAFTFAQGTVDFQNTSTTRLTTNLVSGASGLTTGTGQYTIGLYIAPQGTTDPNAFTLMGPTTVNQSGGPGGAFNGRFNGNPAATSFIISNNTGQAIAFQVRAWSTFAGADYAAAIGNLARADRLLGSSSIGEVTPATGLQLAPALFGTEAGQVGGFVIGNMPEPSTTLLAVIGAAVGLSILRRPSRRKR